MSEMQHGNPPEAIINACASLLGMTPDELKTKLATKAGSREEPIKLLNRKEAAALLHVSTKTIKEWTLSGRLPQLKFGHRTSRYKLSDIRKFMDDNSKPAA